jgi:3-isopropylmalate dehydrogenase
VNQVLEEGFRTADIVGNSGAQPLSCAEMTAKIIEKL